MTEPASSIVTPVMANITPITMKSDTVHGKFASQGMARSKAAPPHPISRHFIRRSGPVISRLHKLWITICRASE